MQFRVPIIHNFRMYRLCCWCGFSWFLGNWCSSPCILSRDTVVWKTIMGGRRTQASTIWAREDNVLTVGANLANWIERDPNPQSGISHRFEADVHGFYQTDLSPVKSAQSLGRGSHWIHAQRLYDITYFGINLDIKLAVSSILIQS